MKVFLIGSGGRENAIAWKISQSEKLTKLYCAPSNPGIDKYATRVNIDVTNIEELCKFALDKMIDLTIVGPELPLSLGIVDLFESKGLKIFGPSKVAAQIETSKCFTKELLSKYNIPTPEYKIIKSYEESIKYIDNSKFPLVVKDDALAAGKGVTVCFHYDQAANALKKLFNNENSKVLIEEYLTGTEASVMAISDGSKAICMLPAQDYKPVYDNNIGPNTGGMGSYSPSAKVNKNLINKIQKNIIDKTLSALKEEGIIYKGVLYAGLMILDNKDVYVLEYNCRFGDPEIQTILPLLNNDFIDILYDSASGNLKCDRLSFSNEYCICVVLTSKGYPDKYKTGYKIDGLTSKQCDNSHVFIAGATKNQDGSLVTSAGRVINVIHKGNDLASVYEKVYKQVRKIRFDELHYRTDIALDGINVIKN